MDELEFIVPDWPVKNVNAVTTTRLGGVSQAPFHSLNLATHVQDEEQLVMQNRQRLHQALSLPSDPLWMVQTHSCEVIEANDWQQGIEADGCIARQTNKICVVMTADCMPVLMTNKQGNVVAAVHAGWRGLCDGILERAVKQMKLPGEEILVWFGPGISASVFEVGDEVRAQFLAKSSTVESAFQVSRPGHWMADLVQIAKARLQSIGVRSFYGGLWCSYSDLRFYSYRRDKQTGRMASLIWMR